MNQSTVAISGCVFGEALSFGQGTTVVFGSVCDGTGGYIGANDGNLYVFASELEAQLLNKGQSLVIVSESEIDMRWLDVVFTGSSIGAFLNTQINDKIIALDTAFVLEMMLDSFRNKRVGEMIEISGTLMKYAGPANPTFVREYMLSYAPVNDSLNRKVIAKALTGLKYRDKIYTWNTAGMKRGNYYLFMDAWLNQDTDSIEVSRKVYLGKTNKVHISWPDQAIWLSNQNQLVIQLPTDYVNANFEVYTASGKLVCSKMISTAKSIENLDFLPAGLYLVRVNSGHLMSIKKILIR